MRNHILTLALVLGAVASVEAQGVRTFVRHYDLGATSAIYCKMDDPFEPIARAKTTNSSTTVTSATTSAFARVSVGDDLLFQVGNTQYLRQVTAKASDDSLTVEASAIDLSGNGTAGYPFKVQKRRCGTTVDDGWVNTAGWINKAVVIEMITLTGTGGVTASIECRADGSATAPSQLVTQNYTGTTAPTNVDWVVIPESCRWMRVGLYWGSADGAGPDSMNVFIVGDVPQR